MPTDTEEAKEAKEDTTPHSVEAQFLEVGHPDHDPEFDQYWAGIYV